MTASNKLSIYLIKDEFADNDNLILNGNYNILTEVEGVGTAYYAPSKNIVPKWIKNFFCEEDIDESLFSSNTRAVLIARIKVNEGNKTFAITFGYGKYLLDDDAIEDDFGLKVVLNTIRPDSLRRINKVNIGGNQKASDEQLPLASEIGDFGFDIERDLIGTITGVSKDKDFVEGIMTGGEVLSVTVPIDINNLSKFLLKTYKRYIATTYRANFGWVDHIKRINDSRLIAKLENELINLINSGSPNIWMAVPDVIEWENISGFKYNGKDEFDDIDISIVKESFSTGLENFEQLRKKRIIAVSALDGEGPYKTWSANRCLYGEIEIDGKAYTINNGKWYCVDNDFVKSINEEYERINISQMDFPIFDKSIHKDENKYSLAFSESDSDYLLCMDRKTISHGGGHSKVELCDVLTIDDRYIHVKPYSGSSTLSHLFNQGAISAELIISDPEFRMKANTEIRKSTDNPEFLIESNTKPHVIFAIISKKNVERPRIPFFSKVAIRYTKRRLEMFGCAMEIKNIYKPEQ